MASSDDADDKAKSPSSPKDVYKDPDDGRQRFLLELEFVQCLANPTYIHYLAQNRYFEDEAFIGYLKYLQYWQRPEYLKFIMYPHCLYFLELLQNANFRNAMAHPGSKEVAHRQQFYFWKNYRNNRLKHILPRSLPEPAPALPAPASAPSSIPPSIPPTSAPSPALSPMQYAIPPGSGVAKNDTRNSGIDRRKRKKEGSRTVFLSLLVTNGTTTTASLFQSSGDADGDAGYVNITDMHGGKVGFGPANTGDLNSFFVKAVLEKPYNLSIIHISQVLDSAEAEAPTPEPTKVNLTSLLSSKGCKEFSHLLTSTGAHKTFQENIESGLTVFCASDSAVKAFMPKYKNLTAGNKTAVLLYHGIPVYSSMGMLKSNNGLMNTLATEGANKYDFTIQNDDESVTIKTKVVTAKITGTIVDEDPLAVFKLDKVLLPRELFKPSATPEPASSPEAEAPGPDTADGPASDDDDEVADSTAHKKKNSAAGLINGGGFLAVGLTLFCVLAAL